MHRRSSEFEIGRRLPELVRTAVEGYLSDPRLRHIDRAFLPSRAEIIELAERLLEVMYPGFYGRQDLTEHNVSYHVGELLPRIGTLAYRQIHKCLSYMADQPSSSSVAGGVASAPNTDGRKSAASCQEQAEALTLRFLDRLPAVRRLLSGDVQAAYDGDPAALNCDEIILAYPGLLAVTIHRLAHELYLMNVPLMPRMMSEWAHTHTGVDIHPGAKIGENFFIDHGSGVVIGETSEIGRGVKIYQGVTLGALSFPKDEGGRIIRGAKRHPTVEDYVTIYANAIVLGGETRIGEHAVIGGSVFLTSSVPPCCTVTLKPPELRVKERDGRTLVKAAPPALQLPDYQI